MNIFKWADEYNWMADYLDAVRGYIYKITAVRDMRDHIPVYTTEGDFIGYIHRNPVTA